MSQVLATRLAVRIEDPDEPFLREAGDVAVAFINLSFPESESGSAKKAPHYPKKTAGEGQQQRSPAVGAAGSDVPRSRLIAERLKTIGDQLDREIEDETKVQFIKMFTQISVFTFTKESFSAACRSILNRFQQRFPTGWHQISLVYHAMIQTIVAVRDEGANIPTQTREQQVANFVGPTLADLGLYAWMANHGGMENFGNPVEGTDTTAVIEESSVDPEN